MASSKSFHGSDCRYPCVRLICRIAATAAALASSTMPKRHPRLVDLFIVVRLSYHKDVSNVSLRSSFRWRLPAKPANATRKRGFWRACSPGYPLGEPPCAGDRVTREIAPMYVGTVMVECSRTSSYPLHLRH